MLIHGVVVAAVRAVVHPGGLALMVTSPVPPLAANSWLVGLNEKDVHCALAAWAPAQTKAIHSADNQIRRGSIGVENPLWHRLLRTHGFEPCRFARQSILKQTPTHMPDAEIIAVGSELLGSEKLDTNSLFLTDQLNALGVEVAQKCVIGDSRSRLTAEVQAAIERSRIVILTGGLGPTEDDVTRDATAAALERGLHFNQDICTWLEERFQRFGRKMAENNKRQAYVIDGAEILPNGRGTAPGQWLVAGNGAVVMLLPGPPHELKAMFHEQVRPRLEAMLPKQVIRTLFYRVAGMGESDVDSLIAPVYTKYENPVTTILAGTGDIQLHLRARCETAEEAEALLAEVGPPIEALLGDRIYSRDGATLEETVGRILRQELATVAVAESATGGMLGARFTTVPGSSAYFKGGFLTYSDEMKTALLGVPEGLLAQFTAVSEEAAASMAEGARLRTGATYGVAVTGEAGPESGSGQPVGLFWVAVSSREGVEAKRFQFPGDRARLRQFATQWALNLLRLHLLHS
jgi:nicotinamide-nucleotide amidase